MDAAFTLGAGLPLWSRLVLFIAALAAWARVCYRWIEVPGMAAGGRLAQRLQKPNKARGLATES